MSIGLRKFCSMKVKVKKSTIKPFVAPEAACNVVILLSCYVAL